MSDVVFAACLIVGALALLVVTAFAYLETDLYLEECHKPVFWMSVALALGSWGVTEDMRALHAWGYFLSYLLFMNMIAKSLQKRRGHRDCDGQRDNT